MNEALLLLVVPPFPSGFGVYPDDARGIPPKLLPFNWLSRSQLLRERHRLGRELGQYLPESAASAWAPSSVSED